MSQAEIDVTRNKMAGFNCHNRIRFTLKKLVADPNPIAANLKCTASCNFARNQGKGMHSHAGACERGENQGRMNEVDHLRKHL
jgi:hypothetical protein